MLNRKLSSFPVERSLSPEAQKDGAFSWWLDTLKSSSWKCDNKSPTQCSVNSMWNLILAFALTNPAIPSASLQQQEVSSCSSSSSSSSVPADQSLFIQNLSKLISVCLCNMWYSSVFWYPECWWIRHYTSQHREISCKGFPSDTWKVVWGWHRDKESCQMICVLWSVFHGLIASYRGIKQLPKKRRENKWDVAWRLLIVLVLEHRVLVWKEEPLWENHKVRRGDVAYQHCDYIIKQSSK